MNGAREEVRWRPLVVLLVVFLTSWGLLHLFPRLRTVAFLGFFSLVFASVLDLPIAWLSRRMPRLLATTLTALALAGLLAGLVALAVPILMEQASRLVQRIPEALTRLESWWTRVSRSDLLSGVEAGGPGNVLGQLRDQVGRIAVKVIPAALGTVAVVGHAVLALVLAIMFAHAPREYLERLVRIVPRGSEESAEELFRRTGGALRRWMVGVLGSMTLVGALTGIGLLVVGIDLWFALAVLSFFGEFVPYAGPVLAAFPGVAVGLAESPATALKVLVVYVAVQQLEGNVIQPLLMRWAVRIPPGLLLLWQLAFLTAFGLGGLIIATPLLAALQAALGYGFIVRVLGKEEAREDA